MYYIMLHLASGPTPAVGLLLLLQHWGTNNPKQIGTPPTRILGPTCS